MIRQKSSLPLYSYFVSQSSEHRILQSKMSQIIEYSNQESQNSLMYYIYIVLKFLPCRIVPQLRCVRKSHVMRQKSSSSLYSYFISQSNFDSVTTTNNTKIFYVLYIYIYSTNIDDTSNHSIITVCSNEKKVCLCYTHT